jgi:hypothetical protein
MSTADIFSLSGSNLNPFLFSEVGIEANGQRLSVVSLLARQGEDPWREAARLATMPVEAAVERLGRAIAAVPASPWPLPAATAIAGRLVAKLPPRLSAAAAFAPGGNAARLAPRAWIVAAIGLAVVVAVTVLRSAFGF